MAWSDRPDPNIATTRTAVAILALVSAFYLVALDRLPIVFGSDEAHFAIHAESLARSGRDLNGRALPVFVRITDPMVPNHSTQIWYQPMLFYLMTPFIGAFGVQEWTARLPVALVAIANLFLLFAIGRRLFGDSRYAVLAALILAVTPAHVIVARQALDYIVPLPFVLGWFLCLLRYLDSGRARDLAVGGWLLGAGMFSYIAAWVLMPCYVLLTAIAVWRSGRPSRGRDLAIGGAAFAIPAAVLAAALASTPDMLTSTLGRYQIGTGASAPGLSERVALYWDYFNPSFLFFAGGSNPTQATGRAGVFLLPLLPLLIAGLREVFRNRSPRWTLASAALAAAPLPIAITMPAAASYSIARAMTLLPFVALVATLGVRWLMRERRLRLLAVACLAGLPIQFALFVFDYRGEYQRRAGPRLDPDNMRAVATAVLPHDREASAPRLYFSHRLDEGGARWRFLMLKAGRLDLWTRSRQINLTESPEIEPGALIVCRAGDPDGARLIAAGYRLVAAIDGVAGEPATVVLKAPG